MVKKGVDLHINRLMKQYDPQGNGTLSLLEFTQLKNDIIDDAKGDPSEMIREILKTVKEQSMAIAEMQQQIASLGGTPRGGGLRNGGGVTAAAAKHDVEHGDEGYGDEGPPRTKGAV